MTETEAKTRWCPMVRVALPINPPPALLAAARAESVSRCIGSGCMMWRALLTQPHKPAAGYCGLAGKM